MSRLAELIEELCPDGVEYRTLGELGSFFGGLSGKSKSDFVEIENAHPFVTYKEVYSLIEIAQCPQGRVAVLPHEKQLALCRGDVLFTGSSENADEVGLTAVVTTDFSEPVYLNSFSMCLRWRDATFDSGYAKYLFTSSEVRRQIRRCASGVTRFNLSKKRLEGVRIPIPPLEVQREIARILDQFTTLQAELEAELEAELGARRTQYEHYRNALLSWELLKGNGVDLMVRPLGELGVFYGGLTGKSKADFVADGDACAFVTYKEVYAQSEIKALPEGRVNVASDEKQFVLKYGDVLFTGSSENRDDVGLTAVITAEFSEPVYLNSFSLCFRWCAEFVDPGYAKYMFDAPDIRREIQRCANGVTRFNLSKKRMEKVRIPIPPLEIQREIMQVLDRFNALVNDISSGLPAEIAARRAQYKHYRDRLLSFPEKAVSGSDAS